MALKENLPKSLIKLYKSLPITGSPNKDNFQKGIDKIYELSVITEKNQLRDNPSLQENERELLDIVKESSPELKQCLSAMPGNYVKLIDNYEAMQDERKMEVWADFREKLRFLVFRMLTAVGIASVILLTSFLAMIWGIPLPLRAGLQ